MINATATSMYGTVLTSPAGFYVVPTVNVIRVPPVTKANGQLACTTSSTWKPLCSYTPNAVLTPVFTGMNEHMQAYYSGQQGPSVVTIDTHQETFSRAPTNTTGYPSTTVISFSTPYLYFPLDAATESEYFDHDHVIYPISIPGAITTSSTLSPTTTISLTSTVTYTYSSSTPPPIDTINVDYGFIPPGIIPWMLQNSDYANQYPGLESCLPGGPSITIADGCPSQAAATAGPVPDLTTSSATTVKGLGCFHPGNCPAAAATTKAPEPAASATAIQASSTASPGNASPGTSPTVAALPEHSQAQSKASTVNLMSVIAPIPVVPISDGQRPTPSSPNQPSASQQTQQPEHQTLHSDSGPGLNSQTGNNVNTAGPIENSSPASTPLATFIQPVPTVQSPGQAQNLPSASSLPVIIIASSTIATDSSSNFVFGSHTIIPGGSPTVISSSTFSLAPSGSALIVNGATSVIQPPPSPSTTYSASPPNLASIIAGAFTGHPAITELSQTISADSFSQFIIGSQTLAPGSLPLTISGSTFSLAPSASAIIINGITGALFVTPSPIPPILTINSQPLTPNPASAYILSSQTLAPGSTPITIAGTTYSLFPSASALLINGHTSLLSPIPLTPQQPANPVLTLPSSSLLTATATSALVYILGTQILHPGGSPITINSTPISLAPSATALIVGTKTQNLPPGSAPVLTLGSQTITASTASAQAYIAGGQTLVPGGAAATINGVQISLAPSGTAVVVGGVTEGFAAPSGGLGGNGSGSAYVGPGFTAGAEGRGRGWGWVVGVGVGVGVLGFWGW